jgi:hypothetical protein
MLRVLSEDVKELSSDEIELLEKYRKFDDLDKEVVRDLIDNQFKRYAKIVGGDSVSQRYFRLV